MMKEFGFYSFNEEKQLSLQQETDTDGCNKSYSIKNTEVKVTREGYCKSPDGNSEKLDRLETDLGGKSDL